MLETDIQGITRALTTGVNPDGLLAKYLTVFLEKKKNLPGFWVNSWWLLWCSNKCSDWENKLSENGENISSLYLIQTDYLYILVCKIDKCKSKNKQPYKNRIKTVQPLGFHVSAPLKAFYHLQIIQDLHALPIVTWFLFFSFLQRAQEVLYLKINQKQRILSFTGEWNRKLWHGVSCEHSRLLSPEKSSCVYHQHETAQ